MSYQSALEEYPKFITIQEKLKNNPKMSYSEKRSTLYDLRSIYFSPLMSFLIAFLSLPITALVIYYLTEVKHRTEYGYMGLAGLSVILLTIYSFRQGIKMWRFNSRHGLEYQKIKKSLKKSIKYKEGRFYKFLKNKELQQKVSEAIENVLVNHYKLPKDMAEEVSPKIIENLPNFRFKSLARTK